MMCLFLQSVNVSRVNTARTQHLHDFKTDTLQDSRSQLRADTSLKSIDLKQYRKSVHVRNGGLKPLKPVGPQRPSIFQCTGITSGKITLFVLSFKTEPSSDFLL